MFQLLGHLQPATSAAVHLETIAVDNRELLLGMQQTMLRKESKYLDITLGQNCVPLSAIFDSSFCQYPKAIRASSGLACK